MATNQLITSTLQEALLLLKTSGYEEDVSYRFIKLEEDFTEKEVVVHKTASGGCSLRFREARPL